jgi:hypothetical protein
MRVAILAELGERAEQARLVGPRQVEAERAARLEAVGEELVVELQLVLGVVRDGRPHADREGRDDAGVGERPGADVDHRQEVAVERVGVAGPDIEIRGRRG